MLKNILCLLLLFSSPAFADDLIADECDIKIEFGSYTSAIDAQTYEKIMNKTFSLPAITGRHIEDLKATGERTLCLTVPDTTALSPTYQALKDILPLKHKTGWERISVKGGETYQTEQSHVFTREEM